MSTFTDGAPPSVSPGPEDGPGEGPGEDTDDDPAPAEGSDQASLWLREEIQRRIAAKGSAGGRHARRDGGETPGTGDYEPRHLVRPTSPPTDDGPATGPLGGPSLPPGPRPQRTPHRSGPSGMLPARHPPAPAPQRAPTPTYPGRPAGPPRSPQAPPPTESTEPPLYWSAAAQPPPLAPPPLPPPLGRPPLAPPLPMSRPLVPPPAPPPSDVEMPGPRRPGPDANGSAPVTIPVGAPGLAAAAAPVESPGEAPGDAAGKRVRVVLAERKGIARSVRTVVDVQEGTAVGELLRSNLIGSQLTVALRFAAVAGLTLGLLPLLFALFPVIGQVEVVGLRLPWLLLGVLVYPFLLLLGWWHTRTAERVEQDFADHVQD